MKATLVVAAREVAERKLVLLGAFLAGLLPLAAPLLPALNGTQARDARFVTALFLSLTIALAFPVVFGATILVSDLAHKRIAFYFSRSLSAFSIWAGKLLAGLVISVSGTCLAAIPTLLLDGKRAFSAFDVSGPATAYFLLTTLFLLVGAHTVAAMARLRSAWIVLDFFMAALCALAIALSLRSLFLAGFWDLYEMKHSPEWLAWCLTAPLIAALLAASYVQVADGRTDTRRSHGALSTTLWGLVTLLALPLAGLAWWVSAATPQHIDAVDGGIQPSPRGTWVNVSGKLRARGSANSAFVYDTESGRFIKRPSLEGEGVAFSPDGTRAVWLQGTPGFFAWSRAGQVRIAALDATNPAAVVSDVETNVWAQLALSPSGRRLAIFDGKILAAYDVSDQSHPRQILAFRIERTSRSVAFVDEDTIRLYSSGFDMSRKQTAPRELEIEEVSLLSKKSLVTGHIEPGIANLRLRMSADGRFLVGAKDKRLTLHDGRTGALLATLSEDLESPKLRFLSGDRLVVAGVANGKAVLKIFLEGEMTESAPPRLVDMGPATSLILGGEVAAGRVAVALNPFRRNDERAQRAWKLAFVDVATGAVSSGPDGLVPADQFSWWFSPTLPPAESGSPASGLFLDASSRLVRLDPATGAQTVLLGRSK